MSSKMAKKRKSKNGSDAATSASVSEEKERQLQRSGDDSRDSDDSSSSDDDSLVLEGVLVRNPDASDSDGDESEISSEEEEGGEPSTKKSKKGNQKVTHATIPKGDNSAKRKSQTQKKKAGGPETVQVDFLFCDMNERFFHGMKTLLHRHGIHAPHSSQLADLIIENEMVGTVLSSDIDEEKKASSKKSATPAAAAMPLQQEANVFGFASIVNVTTNHSSPCIQSLKSLCLKHCPSQHKAEMETVLSGKTKRPAGFFFHERLVNVPLEITDVLHRQLVLDMDHAVSTADDEAERKSLDFGAFVRLAPCHKGQGGGAGNGVLYKYFDDEVFATNAEFVYSFAAPKMHEGDEEDVWCSVVVLTKTGHRAAMKELKKMIHIS